MKIEPPERAIYIRIIMGELQRIANHLMILGTFALDLGAITPIMYEFVQREYIMDISETVSGQRLMPNYLRIGGVKNDIDDKTIERIKDLMEKLPKELDMFDDLITGNEIFVARTKGIGKISTKKAIELGLTGPYLRATGLEWDIRKNNPYCRYDEFDFNVITFKGGDTLDAYKVRLFEMYESAKIILQAIEKLQPGPVRLNMGLEIKPPKGEVYHRIEGPRGELGIYLVSDGSEYPYRLHVRSPALLNLQTFPYLVKGHKIADFCPIISAADPVMGEVDR
jgi:NADH-quinone oxidoreductase subunit D